MSATIVLKDGTVKKVEAAVAFSGTAALDAAGNVICDYRDNTASYEIDGAVAES